MKRLFKIFALAALGVAMLAMAAACNGETNRTGETGLLVKRFSGDEYYTVYGYNGGFEGESSVLDIGAYAEEHDIVIGRIQEGAFEDNNTLTEIIVPSTVETIDAGAFRSMRRLEKITLPFVGLNADSDSYLGESADAEDKAVDSERIFCHIFGTEEFEQGAAVTANYGSSTATYYLPYTLTEVTVAPAGDYGIPMYAFSGVAQLSKITLGEGVNAIGAFAFENCGVQNITLPSTLKNIYDSAFVGATALRDNGISFEGLTLEKIGAHAFEATGLTSLAVNVQTIGEYAFAGSSLRSVTVTGVKEIGAWAFAECEKLEAANVSITVMVGETLVMGTYAFGDITSDIEY